MSNIRLRATVTFEYETDPEYYPDGVHTPTEMAQFDVDTDPTVIFYGPSDDKYPGFTVTAEKVES